MSLMVFERGEELVMPVWHEDEEHVSNAFFEHLDKQQEFLKNNNLVEIEFRSGHKTFATIANHQGGRCSCCGIFKDSDIAKFTALKLKE